MMIDSTLVRRIFIAVNNPWICTINEDPVKVCHDMDYILREQNLTERLMLRSDFRVTDGPGLFPMYVIEVHIEAIGTKTAIDLGVISKAGVKDRRLRLDIDSCDGRLYIELPTDCEDLDADRYILKRNDFNTRNVMTIESDYNIQ